ncbi:MAG: Sulfur carrier protein FdhD [Chloroflexi bacterium]|jgi:FdhD protein|nr:Sulfur carrier protein FdhD [Chloroflexota bacterium]
MDYKTVKPDTKGSRKPLEHWLKAEVLPVQQRTVRHWQDNEEIERADPVVMEEPFEIRLNGRNLAVIMRTPGANLENDRELAVGFLLSEGIITRPDQVQAIVRSKDADGLPEENVLDVKAPGVNPFTETDPENPEGASFERRFVVASSCGLCGKNSIVEACRRLPPLAPDPGTMRVRSETIYGLPGQLREAQAIFNQTGGLHAAGLFDASGHLLLLREDIGRHNAVDKIIGRAALDGAFPLDEKILMVSGRTSFEIVQKALAARIPLIAAVSAPSTLALDLAEEGGITLIGFLRNRSMNVYTHPARIVK